MWVLSSMYFEDDAFEEANEVDEDEVDAAVNLLRNFHCFLQENEYIVAGAFGNRILSSS